MWLSTCMVAPRTVHFILFSRTHMGALHVTVPLGSLGPSVMKKWMSVSQAHVKMELPAM